MEESEIKSLVFKLPVRTQSPVIGEALFDDKQVFKLHITECNRGYDHELIGVTHLFLGDPNASRFTSAFNIISVPANDVLVEQNTRRDMIRDYPDLLSDWFALRDQAIPIDADDLGLFDLASSRLVGALIRYMARVIDYDNTAYSCIVVPDVIAGLFYEAGGLTNKQTGYSVKLDWLVQECFPRFGTDDVEKSRVFDIYRMDDGNTVDGVIPPLKDYGIEYTILPRTRAVVFALEQFAPQRLAPIFATAEQGHLTGEASELNQWFVTIWRYTPSAKEAEKSQLEPLMVLEVSNVALGHGESITGYLDNEERVALESRIGPLSGDIPLLCAYADNGELLNAETFSQTNNYPAPFVDMPSEAVNVTVNAAAFCLKFGEPYSGQAADNEPEKSGIEEVKSESEAPENGSEVLTNEQPAVTVEAPVQSANADEDGMPVEPAELSDELRNALHALTSAVANTLLNKFAYKLCLDVFDPPLTDDSNLWAHLFIDANEEQKLTDAGLSYLIAHFNITDANADPAIYSEDAYADLWENNRDDSIECLAYALYAAEHGSEEANETEPAEDESTEAGGSDTSQSSADEGGAEVKADAIAEAKKPENAEPEQNPLPQAESKLSQDSKEDTVEPDETHKMALGDVAKAMGVQDEAGGFDSSAFGKVLAVPAPELATPDLHRFTAIFSGVVTKHLKSKIGLSEADLALWFEQIAKAVWLVKEGRQAEELTEDDLSENVEAPLTDADELMLQFAAVMTFGEIVRKTKAVTAGRGRGKVRLPEGTKFKLTMLEGINFKRLLADAATLSRSSLSPLLKPEEVEAILSRWSNQLAEQIPAFGEDYPLYNSELVTIALSAMVKACRDEADGSDETAFALRLRSGDLVEAPMHLLPEAWAFLTPDNFKAVLEAQTSPDSEAMLTEAQAMKSAYDWFTANVPAEAAGTFSDAAINAAYEAARWHFTASLQVPSEDTEKTAIEECKREIAVLLNTPFQGAL